MMSIVDVDLAGIFEHNDSNYDYDYEYKDDSDPGQRDVLVPLLYSAVLVVGLLGNALVLAALFRKRRSWSIADTFVLHLCIADVLLLLTLPVWAAQHCWWCFEFGLIPCKISTALFYVNFYCGIFLMVCIVLDRCLSLRRRTGFYTKSRPSFAHITCLCVWICSLVLAASRWIFVATSRVSGDRTTCGEDHPAGSTVGQLVSRLLHHKMGFLLPAATLIVCCACVALRTHGSSRESRQPRAFRTVLCLVGVFLICWTPYNVTLIVDTVRSRSGHSGGSLKTALLVTSVFGYVHTCLRPLLYLSLSSNFRTQALALLRCSPAEPADPLWELGVGEGGETEQSHKVEEQEQMTGGDRQMQSSQC